MPHASRSDLWMIEAVFQEFKLDAVTLALEPLPGFAGMTVSTCRGFGHSKVSADRSSQDDPDAQHAGVPDRHDHRVVDYSPKVKLEIAVAERTTADAVVAVIARAAHTGRHGDGKVFAWRLSHALCVRTGKTDEAAL